MCLDKNVNLLSRIYLQYRQYTKKHWLLLHSHFFYQVDKIYMIQCLKLLVLRNKNHDDNNGTLFDQMQQYHCSMFQPYIVDMTKTQFYFAIALARI